MHWIDLSVLVGQVKVNAPMLTVFSVPKLVPVNVAMEEPSVRGKVAKVPLVLNEIEEIAGAVYGTEYAALVKPPTETDRDVVVSPSGIATVSWVSLAAVGVREVPPHDMSGV